MMSGNPLKCLLAVVFVATTYLLPLSSLAQDKTRFPELKAEQLTPEQKKWADAVAAPPRRANFAQPPYRIYMRSPELAEKITGMSDYLRWNTQFPARLTEFAILLSARHWDSAWIWRGHYRLAIKGGLNPKVAADLAAGKRPEGMQEDEAVLYELATQIYRNKTVSDAAYEAALTKFGERGIVELLGLMGYYDIVAKMLITANAVPPKEVDVPQLMPMGK
jgi:4-carboxymuconolactone decarboxylase